MTGYTVHTGSTEKFSTGWDQIFRKSAQGTTSRKKKPARAKSKGVKPNSRGTAKKR